MGPTSMSSFRAERNEVENYELLSVAKSIGIDLSVTSVSVEMMYPVKNKPLETQKRFHK